jgi:hypothetical protein
LDWHLPRKILDLNALLLTASLKVRDVPGTTNSAGYERVLSPRFAERTAGTGSAVPLAENTLQRDLKRAWIVRLAGVQPRIVSHWRRRFADEGPALLGGQGSGPARSRFTRSDQQIDSGVFAGVFQIKEPISTQAVEPNVAWKLSAHALWVGLPGRLKSSVTWFVGAEIELFRGELAAWLTWIATESHTTVALAQARR